MDQFPAVAQDVLRPLVEELRPFTDSLIVYGSLARGAYQEGVSDINLVVLVSEATPEVLRKIGPALRAAFRKARVEQMVLETGEVGVLAASFPIKFLDIQRSGVVLYGSNPFEGLVIQKGDLRVRIEQELRNHLLRLRRRYTDYFAAPERLLPILSRSIASLRVELSTVVEVVGGDTPRPDWPSLLDAAEPLAIDRAACEYLQAFHDAPDVSQADAVVEMLFGVLTWAIQAAEVGGDAK